MDHHDARRVLWALWKAGWTDHAFRLIDGRIRELVASSTPIDELRGWHRVLLDTASALKDQDGPNKQLTAMAWSLRSVIVDGARHAPNEPMLRKRFSEKYPPRAVTEIV